MESLGTSSKAVVFRRNGSRSLLPFTQSNLRRICITLGNGNSLHCATLKEQWSRTFSPISASASLSQDSVQVDLQESDSQTQIVATDETSTSTTVRVRFLLQKECSFGEQFVLVGDDPVLGLWDPQGGVPLEWSDDHIWAAELDMPIGRTIKYKFILKGNDGNMLWQPDPDRVLETWEASNTIVVLEDWQDPHFQKIVEEEEESVVKEDQVVAEDLKPVTELDLQIVIENSALQMAPSIVQEEELVAVEDPSLQIVGENSAPEESRTVINEVMEEQPSESVVKEEESMANEDSAKSSLHIVEPKLALDQDTESVSISVDPPTNINAATSQENPVPVIADDISHHHQEESSTSHHQTFGENTTSHSKEEPLSPPSNNMDDLNDIDSVSATIDIDGSSVPHESVPVLVQDLSPVPESITDTNASSEGESSGSVAFDASVGGADNNKSPSSQENGSVMEYNKEEVNKAATVELHKEEGSGQQMAAGSASLGQSRPRGGKDCVLQSDVQWVQKLLSNLGLL
ncbi:Phosphoglucan, water dikinase, chloroplastic [Linum grandiflorum]